MHVVLTGASSGIGYCAAQHLVRAGHTLSVSARRLDRLQSLAAQDPERVFAVQADLLEAHQRKALILKATARFGPIDALINNAGMSLSGKASTWLESERAEDVLELNLHAPIQLTRLVLPEMLARRQGHIINITSVAGRVASESLYSASKFGLRGFSLSLRRELLGSGVAVSSLAPGFIRSEMTQTRDPRLLAEPERVAEALLKLLDTPRAEVVVPRYYRPLLWLEQALPSLGDYAVRRLTR